MRKMPRGIRNRNPGNIRHGEDWVGLSEVQNDTEFCTFSHIKYGCRALLKTLHTYVNKHGLKTVREIINRWAPPSENDTESYIKHACYMLMVEPDRELDFSGDMYIKLGKVIAKHENGRYSYTIEESNWDYALSELQK